MRRFPMFWRLAVLAVLSALAAGAVTAATTPASAETNPYTPQRVCGAGYSVIDQQGINGGIVYLLYNSSAGQNCVATIKTVSVGKPTTTTARLEVKGSGTVSSDSGNYDYYAGPVRRAARHQCVRWGGSTFLAGYLSPFEHCG